MPNHVQASENPSRVEDRRQDSRIPLSSITYFYLQDGRCGPIVNISEGGIEVRAELAAEQEFGHLYLCLPNCETKIVCEGKVAWSDTQSARVGIQFTQVPEDSFKEIRGWIVSETDKLREADPNRQSHEQPADRIRDNDFFDFEAFFPSESTLDLDSRKKSSLPGTPVESSISDLSAHMSESAGAPADGTHGHAIDGFAFSAVTPADAMGISGLRQVLNSQSSDRVTESFSPYHLQHASETNPPSIPNFDGAPISSVREPAGRFGHSKRTLSPILTAAIGFGVGLVLCAFVIFGPFDFARAVNNLLTRPDQAPRTVGDTQTGANSVQSPLDIDISSTAASQALAIPPNDAPEQQVKADRVARQLKETNGSVTLADRAIKPSSVAPTSTGRALASPPAASVALEPQTPPVPVVSAALQQPDVQKVSGAVTSTSQFVAVHTPQENLSGVLQMGQITAGPEPLYPAVALQSGTEGTVVLRAVVSADGSVQKVDAVSGPPELVTAAMAAVHNWHYTPTMVADKPVESEYNIILVFRLTR